MNEELDGERERDAGRTGYLYLWMSAGDSMTAGSKIGVDLSHVVSA